MAIEEVYAQMIIEEYKRARENFPPFHSTHEGYAIIKEEFDELWQEIMTRQSTPGRSTAIRKEAIQTGAMVLRFLIDLKDVDR